MRELMNFFYFISSYRKAPGDLTGKSSYGYTRNSTPCFFPVSQIFLNNKSCPSNLMGVMILSMYVRRFWRRIRTWRPTLYEADADETKTTETWMGMAIYANLDYSGLEIRIISRKLLRNKQVCQLKCKTLQTVSQDYTWYSETTRKQQTPIHSLFRGTINSYLLPKTWPEFSRRYWNMTEVTIRQGRYLLCMKVNLRGWRSTVVR